MSFKTIAASAPYYDDFDATKNYLQLLFNPGRSVQARELTQLQTTLQNQVSTLSNHFFKNNSVVLGCNINHSGNNAYIEIDSSVDLDDIDHNMVVSNNSVGNSNVTAKVITTFTKNSKKYIFVNYIAGDTFVENSVVAIANTSIAVLSTGFGTIATCEHGIIYTDGRFVIVNPQIVAVDIGYDGYYRIGYTVTESVVTAGSDSTLSDPSAGYYNTGSIGADRYKVELSLSSIIDNKTTPVTIPQSFIEIVVLDNKKVLKSSTKVQYSDILDLFASRTYDESGNYTLKDFKINLYENTDLAKSNLEIQPGKAYVRGYEVSKEFSETLEIPKAREILTDTGLTVRYQDYGTYVVAEFSSGDSAISTKGLPSPGTEVELFNNSSGTMTSLGKATIVCYKQAGLETRIYLRKLTVSANVLQSVKAIGVNSSSAITLKRNNNITYVKSVGGMAGIKTQHVHTANVAGDISYQCNSLYTATASGNSITITSLSNAVDFDNSPIAIYNTTTQKPISILSSTVIVNNATNPSTMTITNANINNGNVIHVIANNIVTGNLTPRTKTLTTVTQNITVTPTDSKVSLGSLLSPGVDEVLDLVEIKSVKQVDNNIGGGSNVTVTDVFLKEAKLDTGARDYTYEVGSITVNTAGMVSLKANNTISTTYTVEFTHFKHSSFFKLGTSTPAIFFTASSYNLNTLSELPMYTTETGEHVNLVNVVDFRTAPNNAANQYYITPSTPFYSQTSRYLGRIDKLYIGSDGKFGLITGVAADTPFEPADIKNALTLYTINVPPYTFKANDITMVKHDNKAYTMKDIANLDRRIGSLENYTALTLLEKKASDLNILDAEGFNKFKSGIFVDNFQSYENSNTISNEFRAVIDIKNAELRGPYDISQFDLVTKSSNIKEHSNIATLNYTTKVYAQNNLASESINVNPYLNATWNGTVTLDPPIDNWVDVVTPPASTDNPTLPSKNIVSHAFRHWDGWRDFWIGYPQHKQSIQPKYNILVEDSLIDDGSDKTFTTSSNNDIITTPNTAQTTTFGGKEINDNVTQYMREKTVAYSATGLRPLANVKLYFDGKDLGITEQVNSNGSLSGTFNIAGGTYQVGTKIFEIKDDADTTFASTNYTASGTITTDGQTPSTRQTQIRIDSSRVIRNAYDWRDIWQGRGSIKKWFDPVAQSFLIDSEGGAFISSIDVYFKTIDSSTPITLFIVEMENGYPTSKVLPFSTVTMLPTSTSNDGSVATQFLFSDPVYLNDGKEYAFILTSTSNEYQVYTSTLGSVDLLTSNVISKQPYLGSLFKSQNSTTWTADQLSDIKFIIRSCEFNTTAGTYVLSNDAIFSATTLCPAIGELKLPSTDIVWSSNNNDLPSTLINGENYDLVSKINPARKTFDMSGILTTANKNISPVIDMHKRFCIAVSNVTQGQSYPYNIGTHITKAINLLTPSDDIRVILDAIKPVGSDVKVYYKTGNTNPMFAIKNILSETSGLPNVNTSLYGKQLFVSEWDGTNIAQDATGSSNTAIVTSYNTSTNSIYIKSISDISKFNVAGNKALLLTESVISNTGSATVLSAWNSATTYSINDYVYTSDGKLFKALANSLIGTGGSPKIPGASSSWLEIRYIAISGAGGTPVQEANSIIGTTALYEEISNGWKKMKLNVQPAASVELNTKYFEYTYVPETPVDTAFKSYSIKIELTVSDKNHGGNVPKIKNLRAIAAY